MSVQFLKTKKKFAAHAGAGGDDMDFASALSEMESTVKENAVVTGRVVDITGDIVVVDVGLKNEGRIPISEFALATDQKLPEIGDSVDVYVEKFEGYNGRTILSREKAIHAESWRALEDSYERGLLVNGVIFGSVKGGFTVDLSGVVAFLPGSQVDIRPVKDITPLMDVVQPFKILKMDKKLGNIVVSRRAILEESHSGARDEMLANIQEGMVLEGVIKNITTYGAFVDLGNVDGLLHVTDISWNRINHPSEALSIGQKVSVMVIKFNEETKRISLGMKQMEKNPWLGIKEQFPVGMVMSGRVTDVTDYGAFVSIMDGVEGLVHSSEISWIKSQQNAKKYLSIGNEVEFMILDVDEEKHRISLSIKQCKANPWKQFVDTHEVGQTVTGPIRNIHEFGLFVALNDDIDGMVHESDISWYGDGASMMKTFKKGQTVSCKILSMDAARERVALGLKQLSDRPDDFVDMDTYSKGQIVNATITSVLDDGIEVDVASRVRGFVKRIELAADKEDQRSGLFNVGDVIAAKIVSIDKSANKLMLSIKGYELDERERTMSEYSMRDTSSNLGNMLEAAISAHQQRGEE